MSGDFSIGSNTWPGLGKLIEEAGEMLQVAGKLISSRGVTEHWDGGAPLDKRLEEELADLRSAARFVIEYNGLDADGIAARSARKSGQYEDWHRSNAAFG